MAKARMRWEGEMQHARRLYGCTSRPVRAEGRLKTLSQLPKAGQYRAMTAVRYNEERGQRALSHSAD